MTKLTKCPNCKAELKEIGNKSECSECNYSISYLPKKESKGSKYVQQVNRIIKDMLVESKLTGEPVPWKQPWIIIPKRNYDSNREYNGINRWLLSYSNDVSFITEKSIEKKGLSLNEKAENNFIICWIPAKLKKEEKKLSKEVQKNIMKRRFPLMVTHCIYKSTDVDGLDEKTFDTDKDNKKFDSIEDFIKSSKVKIVVGGNRARYDWMDDVISIPRLEQFEDSQEYYRTVFHELAHSTGHKSRLNRDEKKFSRLEEYSKEELIAELASAYMCMYFGIEPTENTTAYVESWLDAIESDPYLLVSAGQQAEKVLTHFQLN